MNDLLLALLVLLGLVMLIGLVLRFGARRFAPDEDSIVETINAELPQTQCAQCGYPGCRPYAEAIARGEADINRCPPGGEAGVRALADLLGREPLPLDASCGDTKPPQVAVIDEDRCIGCTLCIQACPVDAILGDLEFDANTRAEAVSVKSHIELANRLHAAIAVGETVAAESDN